MKLVKQIKHNGTTWYHLQEPDQKQIEALQANFRLHPLDIEDVSEQRQRPKLDIYHTYLFFVLHFPVWNESTISLHTRQLSIFILKNTLITVAQQSIPKLNSLFEQAQNDNKKRRRFFKKSPLRLFYFIVNQLLKGSNPIKKSISRQLDTIDKDLSSSKHKQALRKISDMRRSLVFFQTIIKPQIPIFTKLETIKHTIITEEFSYYWGNLQDKLRSDWEEIEDYSEILNGLSETNESLLSYRTNEIIKLLTIFSVVLMPLNLIAGIYGMNIRLPIGQNPLAFGFLISLMLTLSLLMVFYFKIKKWV